MIIPSTYQLLAGFTPKITEKVTRKIVKLTDKTDVSHYEYERKRGYILKNADKPCSKCGNPERHKSPKTGKVYNTLCFKCTKEAGEKRYEKARQDD